MKGNCFIIRATLIFVVHKFSEVGEYLIKGTVQGPQGIGTVWSSFLSFVHGDAGRADCERRLTFINDKHFTFIQSYGRNNMDFPFTT